MRKTDAGHDRTGRLLLDAVVDVDLIIRTWNLRRFYVHFLEEAQALETSFGLVNQIGRRPTTFHLAHLATQHFIFGLGIPAEIDAIDVRTLTRVDDERDRHRIVFVVSFRNTVDVGKGIAFVTQAPCNQLGGGSHHLAREHLTFFCQQQRLDLFLRNLEITAQLDVAHGIALAFVDVHGDIDVLLVWRYGYLGRGDIHVDVTAIQVIRAQAFQVTGELFTRVLVVVAEERQPVCGLQLEQIHQIFVREDRIAHDIDVLDRRHRAFVDLDLQRHPITRLRNDLGFDGRRIAPLGNVLALQFITYTLERGLLKDFPFGQTGLLQT